jgi:hypothetical protein
MMPKAEVRMDLVRIMSLLLELEKERPDSRITQAKKLTSKALRELDELHVARQLKAI